MLEPNPLILLPGLPTPFNHNPPVVTSIGFIFSPKAAHLLVARYGGSMQMAVQPFPSLHVLQPDDGPARNAVTLPGRCFELRSNNPVAVSIVDIWKPSDRLLAAARAIRHVVGVQPKLGPLVHKLQHASVCDLDALSGGGVACIEIEAEEEEDSKAEKAHGHGQEQGYEPGLLPEGELRLRSPAGDGDSSHDPTRLCGRRRRGGLSARQTWRS